MVGIYKITSPSNKVYIGQSVDIERRKSDHRKCNDNGKLQNSIRKYGFENHSFEILEECSIELLNERERHYQDFYDVLGPNGLNLKLTETNDKSGYCSNETKSKLSEYHKNRSINEKLNTVRKCLETKSKETDEERQLRLKKISEASKRKTMSTETRLKISLSIRGRKLTTEHKTKISESQKGKVVLKSSIEKMKATKNKIDPISGLTNAQLSTQKNIGRKQTQESKDKFKQTILNKQLKKKNNDN